VRHLDCFGHPSQLVIRCRRYRHADCTKSFVQPLPGIRPGWRSSEPWHRVMFERRHDGICAASLARCEGLGQATVRRTTPSLPRARPSPVRSFRESGICSLVSSRGWVQPQAVGRSGGIRVLFSLMQAAKFTAAGIAIVAILGIGVAVHENLARRAPDARLAEVVRDRDALRQRLRMAERRPLATEKQAAPSALPSSARPSAPEDGGVRRLDFAPSARADSSVPSAPSAASIKQPPSAAESAAVQARKAEKHRRYDRFMEEGGLTPAQADRFVELLIEQDDVRGDLQAAILQSRAELLKQKQPQTSPLRPR